MFAPFIKTLLLFLLPSVQDARLADLYPFLTKPNILMSQEKPFNVAKFELFNVAKTAFFNVAKIEAFNVAKSGVFNIA